MGSQWTSKYAILRDLSFAQGRDVPVTLAESIGVGQKPPAIKIKEDTEEEFFEKCAVEGDAFPKPDLGLIKEMISMVLANDPADQDDEDTERVVEIGKLNPLCEEFVPKTKQDRDEQKEDPKGEKTDTNTNRDGSPNPVNAKPEMVHPKKQRQRNVALLSLLEKEQFSQAQALVTDENVSPNTTRISENKTEIAKPTVSLEVKLLKPDDFITDTNLTEAVEKVNEWLHKPVDPQPENTMPVKLSTNMFKKKPPASLFLDSSSMFKRKTDTSSIKSSDSDTVPRQPHNVFVPSTQANEYYQKFVERREIQEKAQEDMWQRAKRLMKEIDEKRLKKKELAERVGNTDVGNEEDSTTNGTRPSCILNIPGVKFPFVSLSILLPQHRHELPETCKVCLAVAKYQSGRASQ